MEVYRPVGVTRDCEYGRPAYGQMGRESNEK